MNFKHFTILLILFNISLALAENNNTLLQTQAEFDKDVKVVSLEINAPFDNIIYESDELYFSYTVKNSGNDPLPPIAVTLTIYNADDKNWIIYSKNVQAPPMLSDSTHTGNIGSWNIIPYLTKYIIRLQVSLMGDENPDNDYLEKTVMAYPKPENAFIADILTDSSIIELSVKTLYGDFFTSNSTTEWTVFDSTFTPDQEYLNTWHLAKDTLNNKTIESIDNYHDHIEKNAINLNRPV